VLTDLFCARLASVMPSTRVVAVGGKSLSHGLEGFVAPTSNVVGDVEMGTKASVWYGATVRGTSSALGLCPASASLHSVICECLAK